MGQNGRATPQACINDAALVGALCDEVCQVLQHILIGPAVDELLMFDDIPAHAHSHGRHGEYSLGRNELVQVLTHSY